MCVETVWGTVREQAPVAYQSIDDTRIPVEVAFLLVDDRTFGFEIGPEYDPTMPLVIDPILLFGTYL